MADKKKFDKPQMEVIKMDAKVKILAGSLCHFDSSGGPGYCPDNSIV